MIVFLIGGYFVGNFFGLNDSWAKTKEQMVFLSKKQVLELFAESFEILEFGEIDKDGKTALEKCKHWHIYNVIAKKKERKSIENIDLTLDVQDYKLNIRAAGILIHNGKVLVHRNLNSDHYALVGGRVKIGEYSATTLKREIKEEIGKDIEILGYISTIENFFEMKNSKYHEIMFVHRIEFLNEEDKQIEYTIKNIEGKDYLQYEWIDISKIDDYPIVPKVIKSILKENLFPLNKINNDL